MRQRRPLVQRPVVLATDPCSTQLTSLQHPLAAHRAGCRPLLQLTRRNLPLASIARVFFLALIVNLAPSTTAEAQNPGAAELPSLESLDDCISFEIDEMTVVRSTYTVTTSWTNSCVDNLYLYIRWYHRNTPVPPRFSEPMRWLVDGWTRGSNFISLEDSSGPWDTLYWETQAGPIPPPLIAWCVFAVEYVDSFEKREDLDRCTGFNDFYSGSQRNWRTAR